MRPPSARRLKWTAKGVAETEIRASRLCDPQGGRAVNQRDGSSEPRRGREITAIGLESQASRRRPWNFRRWPISRLTLDLDIGSAAKDYVPLALRRVLQALQYF